VRVGLAEHRHRRGVQELAAGMLLVDPLDQRRRGLQGEAAVPQGLPVVHPLDREAPRLLDADVDHGRTDVRLDLARPPLPEDAVLVGRVDQDVPPVVGAVPEGARLHMLDDLLEEPGVLLLEQPEPQLVLDGPAHGDGPRLERSRPVGPVEQDPQGEQGRDVRLHLGEVRHRGSPTTGPLPALHDPLDQTLSHGLDVHLDQVRQRVGEGLEALLPHPQDTLPVGGDAPAAALPLEGDLFEFQGWREALKGCLYTAPP
jgi:hypothetical protein